MFNSCANCGTALVTTEQYTVTFGVIANCDDIGYYGRQCTYPTMIAV